MTREKFLWKTEQDLWTNYIKVVKKSGSILALRRASGFWFIPFFSFSFRLSVLCQSLNCCTIDELFSNSYSNSTFIHFHLIVKISMLNRCAVLHWKNPSLVSIKKKRKEHGFSKLEIRMSALEKIGPSKRRKNTSNVF